MSPFDLLAADYSWNDGGDGSFEKPDDLPWKTDWTAAFVNYARTRTLRFAYRVCRRREGGFCSGRMKTVSNGPPSRCHALLPERDICDDTL